MIILKPAPGPHGRLLLDSLRLLQKDPLAFLLHSTQTYGDFVRLPLQVAEATILNHPEAVKHVLQDNHRNYSKDTFQYNALAAITGRGLLTSDGDFWLRQRRLAQPAFHRSRILSLAGLITGATIRMLARWEQPARERQPIDIDAEMLRLTLEIVGKALFSVDLSAEAGELTGAVLTALDHLIYRSRNPFSPPAFIPTGRNRRFQAALHMLDQAVFEMITERRALAAAGRAPEGDLLAMLIEARDPETGAGMNDRHLRDEILTLLIAGHETVASALTWTWYLLAKHSGTRDDLQSELSNRLAGRTPAAADLAGLPLTQSVFDEALRLFPPAWIITRKALGEDGILGFSIPRNALVIISPYTLHRHPGFWVQPEAFDPNRFTPERVGARPRFAYIPFGGGPRLCIGDTFARFEAQLILATVAQQYRLDLPPGGGAQVEALVTLRPRDGLKMLVQNV